MLKKNRAGMDWARSEWTRLSKHSQVAIRDSSSSCVKDKISKRRQTILEIEKKSRQKLEQRASQFLSLLGAVRLYQILAFPSKEKEKSFHLKVSVDMPLMCRNTQVCLNSFKCEDSHLYYLKRIVSVPSLSNMGVAHSHLKG
jgi:hypothetical protein